MALLPHHMKQVPIVHLGMVLLLASACSSVPCAFAAQQPHPHAGAGVTEGDAFPPRTPSRPFPVPPPGVHLNYIKARLVVTPVADGVNLDGAKAPLSINGPEATLKGPHSSNLPAAQHRQLHSLGTSASLISINDLKEAAERCAAITGLVFGAAVASVGARKATVYSASRTNRLATAWKNKYVILGPVGLASSIKTGATEDIDNAPVIPLTFDGQDELSKVTYALDTTCSSLDTIKAIGKGLYEWGNKIKEGTRPTPDVDSLKAFELEELPSLPSIPTASLATEIAEAIRGLADNLPDDDKALYLGLVDALDRTETPSPKLSLPRPPPGKTPGTDDLQDVAGPISDATKKLSFATRRVSSVKLFPSPIRRFVDVMGKVAKTVGNGFEKAQNAARSVAQSAAANTPFWKTVFKTSNALDKMCTAVSLIRITQRFVGNKLVINSWNTCAGQQSRRLLSVEGSAANFTEVDLLDCLPGGDAVAEVFEAINIAADAFEGINSKVSNSIEELLDSIEGPFEQALKKSNQVAEQLTGVVSVAKGLVNNEVFQAVLGGLEAFNRAITARVKFTINLGTLCLWTCWELKIEIDLGFSVEDLLNGLAAVTDWLSAAIDWVVDKVLSVLGLDELVNRLINAILEPLKLGVLGELGDVFNGLVNLNAAQFLQDRAIAALRDVQDDIPLDAVKTALKGAVEAAKAATGLLDLKCLPGKDEDSDPVPVLPPSGVFACTPGWFGAWPRCAPAPRGFVAPNYGMSQPDRCSPGTFAFFPGQTYCYRCPAGTVTEGFDRVICYECPAGTSTQGLEGQTVCTSCSPGSFSPAPATPQCKPCPPGTFQPDAGKTFCIACTGNTYAGPGATACTQCDTPDKPCAYASADKGACLPQAVRISRRNDTGVSCSLEGLIKVDRSEPVLECGTPLPDLRQTVLGWKAVDAWTDISVTADQTPEAPGLPDADGKQKLPVSPATFMNFTLGYKAFDTTTNCQAVCADVFSVVDSTPPTIYGTRPTIQGSRPSVTRAFTDAPSLVTLWPGNGTYYPIRVIYSVADVPNCNPRDDIPLRCRIIGVTSSSEGSGFRATDIFAAFPPGAGNPTGRDFPQVVMLRARKLRNTDVARRYTIHSECFDEQGNRAATTNTTLGATVTVPASCRGNDRTCQDAARTLTATVYPASTNGVWVPSMSSDNLVLASVP